MKKLYAYERIGPHNYDILCLIYGTLLGDCYGECRNGSIRFCFQQENSNVEYIMWFHKYLSERGYCSIKKPRLSKRIGLKNKIRFRYDFNTYSYTSFYFIWESFYKNSKKIVPRNLELFFTPLCLAVWFMNDGTVCNDSVKLCTNSFSLEDLTYLIFLFYKKYQIIATVHKAGVKDQYTLYIRKESHTKFCLLIKPFMIPSMQYKLNKYIYKKS